MFEHSLSLISYKAINKRIRSKTCCEKQLRRASLGYDALILFSSLGEDWKQAIIKEFGEPIEKVKNGFRKNICYLMKFQDGDILVRKNNNTGVETTWINQRLVIEVCNLSEKHLRNCIP